MPDVIDEEQKDARFHELNKKQGRTPEEETELGKLKDDYRQSAKQRIDQITAEKHKERIAREEAERKAQELEDRLAKLEAEKQESTSRNLIQAETLDIGGKKFYTDDTLAQMLESRKINQDQAWLHQQQRLKAEAAEEAYQRLKNEEKQGEFSKIRQKDFEQVLSKYPQLNTKSDKYNPDDLLTKTVTRLWNNGYSTNADGLSRAVADAEEYIRLMGNGGARVDVSDDLSTSANDQGTRRGAEKKKEETVLSDGEIEAAKRMYRDQINPTTQRQYTEAEIVEKAKRAKVARRK